ncbi:MAG TPA: hypothetical protein VFW65_03845 [Pseudonocardiaceae bacterium]|nr:hypothetical protein [Pseudonocardiaceae bacterium]
MASEDEARADGSAGDLLGPAWSLRWRAPELALMFAERAGAVAQLTGEGPDHLRAEATVVVATCRLGRRLDIVERGIAALRLAERRSEPGTAAALRVELAGCARAAGVPLVGSAVLRSVLTSDDVRPSVRADGLVELVSCLAQLVDPGVLDDGLAEADRLYAEAGEVDADTRVVRRALLRSVASGELRRRGDVRAAIDAAQEGADLLASLNRASADNGAASARVALRLVHGLLDLGRMDEAGVIATAELAKPVRAPAATAIGWLALAVAVRKYLAGGTPVPALALLRDAAGLAERHRLGTLRAEVLTTLSDAHERVGQLGDALDCLRTAQGVRLRRARAVYGARTKLVGAFGETTGPEEFVQLITGGGGRRAAGSRAAAPGRENAAALLGRFGLGRPIEATVAGGPRTDVTMVLVDVTHGDPAASRVGEQVVSQVLDQVRAAAPTQAQVARVGGAEFAVLLPAALTGQAELWVQRLRGAIDDVDWAAMAPGLAVNVRVAVAQQSSARTREPALTTAAPQAPAPQPAPTPEPPPAPQPAAAATQPAATSHSAAAASQLATTAPQPTTAASHSATAASQPAAVVSQPATAAPQRAAAASQPAAASHSAVAASHSAAAASRSATAASRSATAAPQPAAAASQAPRQAAPAPAPPSMFELPTVPIMPIDIGAAIQPPTAPTESAPLPARVPGAAAGGSPGPSHATDSAAGETGRNQPGFAGAARSGGTAGPSHAAAIAPGADTARRPGQDAAGETGAGQSRHGTARSGQAGTAAPPEREPTHPVLPALPIPPPLEPERPVFRATTPNQGRPGDVAMSSDPSVRISAADISSAGSWPDDNTGESQPRHAVDTGIGPSVLSSLGITAGSASGGGRRRARESTDEPPTDPVEPPTDPVETPTQTPEPSPDSLFGASAAEPATSGGGLTNLGPAFRAKPADPPAQPQPQADQQPEQPPEPQPEQQAKPPDQPPRTGGKRRRSVQLADLLTEALMAYQSAQDSNEAKNNPVVDPSASLPGPTNLPGPLARPVERLDPAVGDPLPGYPARHRGDPPPSDSVWRSRRWKQSDERP